MELKQSCEVYLFEKKKESGDREPKCRVLLLNSKKKKKKEGYSG